MTYIIGWKHEGNIYLTSDSAIRRDAKFINSASSSVGENQISTASLSINEESYKLFQIEDDCIIAISGDVSNALELVNNIRNYSTKNDRAKLLDKFCNSSRGKLFSAIIGLIVDDKPKLFVFQSEKTRYLQEKENFVCQGSGVSILVTKTQKLVESIANQKLDPSERLAFLVAGHQLFSIRENIFVKGVGGIFNGVRISKEGVKWNEDIAYVFYSSNTRYYKDTDEISGDTSIIFTFNRDLMLYVKSPHPIPIGTDKLIPNCEQSNLTSTSTEVLKWNANYFQKINLKIRSEGVKTKFLSLIYKSDDDKYRVSLVKGNNKTLKKVNLEFEKEGWYYLKALKETLKKLILDNNDENVTCTLIKE